MSQAWRQNRTGTRGVGHILDGFKRIQVYLLGSVRQISFLTSAVLVTNKQHHVRSHFGLEDWIPAPTPCNSNGH